MEKKEILSALNLEATKPGGYARAGSPGPTAPSSLAQPRERRGDRQGPPGQLGRLRRVANTANRPS